MRKNKIFTIVLIGAIMTIVILTSTSQAFLLDPGPGGGGSGGGYTFNRQWKYDLNLDAEGDGGDTHIVFKITEYIGSIDIKLTYDILIEYYYIFSFDYNVKVDRYDPVENIWIRNWITDDDTNTTDLGNEHYKLSMHEVQSFYYARNRYGYFVGCSGGIVSMFHNGVIDPIWGCALKFKLATYDYGSPYGYYLGCLDDHIYSFFGEGAENSWYCHVLKPSGAWYREM